MHPLAEKLSKERSQQKEEEIKEDQSVQGLSHHGLPALWRKHSQLSTAAEWSGNECDERQKMKVKHTENFLATTCIQ